MMMRFSNATSFILKGIIFEHKEWGSTRETNG